MGLYPFEFYRIETVLEPSEIVNLVERNIWIKTGYNSSILQNSLMQEWDKFEGRIQKNKFRINRIPNGRDAVPLVIGRIKTQSATTTIHVVIRWPIIIYVFMSIWLTGAFIAFVAFMMEAFKKGGVDIIGPFIAGGFFAIGYLMMTLLLKRESPKARRFLNQLFKS